MTIKQISEICKGKARCWLCPFYNANDPMMCRFNGEEDPSAWDIDIEVNTDAEN